MMAKAYYTSYKLPVIITRGNNVYGPNQFPEKLIPKFTLLASRGRDLPVHGDGKLFLLFSASLCAGSTAICAKLHECMCCSSVHSVTCTHAGGIKVAQIAWCALPVVGSSSHGVAHCL